MTYLLSSAGALIVDRNAWHSRASTAWGPSRDWNSGVSFEDQAWTGSGYGSGVLWSDAAHDDPNVWTNRYNAGYAQATTDKQPPAAVTGTDTAMGNVTTARGTWVSASGSYTAPITGNWSLLAEARGKGWSQQETCGGQVRIVWSGGTITGVMTHFRPEPYFNVSGTMHIAYGVGVVSAGQSIHIEILVNSDTSGNQLTFDQIVLRPRFISTQANPH